MPEIDAIQNFMPKFVGDGVSSGKLIRTLYRGVSIPLLFGAPSTAVFFGSFTIGRQVLFRDPCRQMNFVENFCAGTERSYHAA
uniref:Uncharacterized protein n=1 Tax=Ditylenchus dipsaci TaxID=166011 RepID=A0A915DTY0_9BILA